MTAATARPLVREVKDADGKLMVVEITERVIAWRPKGTRRGGAQEVQMTHGQAYLRAMMARVDAERRQAKRERGR